MLTASVVFPSMPLLLLCQLDGDGAAHKRFGFQVTVTMVQRHLLGWVKLCSMLIKILFSFFCFSSVLLPKCVSVHRSTAI